uniref:TPX2 domain-containing protein n=1 Tax=Panagrellus redivivus TaxID=6233 RepID=A0A7E4W286_PANRE
MMSPPACHNLRATHNAYITPPNVRKTSLKALLMAPRPHRMPQIRLTRDPEMPFTPVSEVSMSMDTNNNESFQIKPITKTPEKYVSVQPNVTPEMPRRAVRKIPMTWAPKKPNASRRLGLVNLVYVDNAPSTPVRPIRAIERQEMLLRAPKTATRKAPPKFAVERSFQKRLDDANTRRAQIERNRRLYEQL